MISVLRLRLAIEIVAALFAITMVATLVAAYVQTEADLDAALSTFAEQLLSAREAAAHGGRPADGVRVYRASGLPEGTIRADLTARFSAILAMKGSAGDARVMSAGKKTLTIALAGPEDTYLVATMLTPRSLFEFSGFTIAAWLLVLLAGLAAVGVLLATRLTGALDRLKAFVSAPDDADGLPPVQPETGRPEEAQVAQMLNAIRSRWRQSVEQRLRVIAMAAHDMRGPLQRMKFRAEFLNDNERPAWLGDVEEVSAICDEAVRYVKNRPAAEPAVLLRLDEVVAGVVADFRATMQPVDLVRSAHVSVVAQPLALRRLLGNIIGNAATHGGGARVSLVPEGETALLVVEDSGPGLPEELLEKVFDPFFRHEAADRPAVHGSGLGLAIARGIAEQMGGTITLSNRPEGGLRQEVRFPGATVLGV